MTRINVGVNPQFLTDEHLLAEHREIKRVCSRLIKRNGDITGAPDKFTLGTGHELFFLRYGEYTRDRYIDLLAECEFRGFKVTNYSCNWNCYNNFPNLLNDYTPAKEDVEMIVNRIISRITESPKQFFHYHGDRIDKNNAIELIKYQLNEL